MSARMGVLLATLAGAAPMAGGEQAPPPPAEGDKPAAAPQAGKEADKADAASGDELMQFEDIPVVITGSRTEQPITQSSVSVSIITAEDIRYSGLVHIEDLLLSVPGTDVLRLDRNRSAIGVRGLHHEFADRTLFLVDGRDASDPMFAGVDFQRLPLFVADIDRIEVVRGPGGAAWGANAFNGVVNVLSKSPEHTTGFYASTRINEYGDSFTHLRYGDKNDSFAWRVSLGYEDQESSQDAIIDDHFSSNDFARRYLLDSQGVYKFSKETSLRFGLGATNFTRGSEEFLTYKPEENYNFHSLRPFAKLEQTWDSDTSGYIRWFGNFDDSDRPGFWSYFGTENDVEAQYNFKAGSAHHVSVGANARLVTMDTNGNPPDTVLAENFIEEGWLGAFAIDRWDITKRFTLETQGRVDWYSETDVDWSGRLTGMYGLDSAKHHMVRAGLAKAFRAPSAAIRNLEVLHMPLGFPDMYGINLVHPPSMRNEEVYMGEVGYTGTFEGGFSTNLTGYAARYEELIGSTVLDDPLGMGRSFYTLDNIDGANAYGFEGEVALTGEKGKVSLWYAYNAFDPDQGSDQGVRAFRPAEHKVGSTLRWFITDRLAFNTSYRYTSQTENTPADQAAVDATHAWDVALTYRLWGEGTEMTFGVTDLLDSTDVVVQQVGQFDSHETPGRTFFGMIRISF